MIRHLVNNSCERMEMAAVMSYFEVLPHQFPSQSAEERNKPHSEYLKSGIKCKLYTPVLFEFK